MQKALTSAKDELISTMRTTGIIPVFHHSALLEIITLSYRCGVRMFEITYQRDSRGLRLFSWLAAEVRQLPGLTLGVGTMLDATMAERYIDAGAGFIASPFLQKKMGEVCRQQNVLWMPGCSTLDDVKQASDLGTEVVTVLSGNILGPDFLKQVNKELPHMLLVPSSGVGLRENNLQRWFDAGAICVRLGEALFPKESVAIRDWIKIENGLVATLETVKRIKAKVEKANMISIL